MEALTQLFDDLSRDFNIGTFETHLEKMVLPTTMYVADSVIFMADQVSLLRNLNTFRNNLIKLGFTRIEPEILSITQIQKLSARVTVRWHFFNSGNEAFSSYDLIYFCTNTEKGWLIALTETPNPLDVNVTGGLPIT